MAAQTTLDQDTMAREAFRLMRLADEVARWRRALGIARVALSGCTKREKMALKPLAARAATALHAAEARLAAAQRAEDGRTVTAELRQHHDVDRRAVLGGEGERILTRLDALFEAGLIDAAEVTAGETYRADYEFGELGGALGGRYEDAPGGGGAGDGDGARLDALKRLADARAMLPGNLRAAMDGVAQDAPWREMGRRLGRDPAGAKKLAVDALQRLATHYRLRGAGSRMRAVEIGKRTA